MSDSRIETIRELCSFERRLAGTDAERRAANRLAERIRALGRSAEIEPTYVHPQAPLIYAFHCTLAFAGSLVAVAEPAAGFALVLLAATSLYLDLNTRIHLIRQLFFRRASQNVVSTGSNPQASARLILVAHYDAGRGGTLFEPKQAERAGRLTRLLPFPHTRFLFWSMAVLLPMIGARMAGLNSDVVALGQLLPTLCLLIAIFLLADIQLSPVSPGANDNASGVAVALSAAESLGERPPKHLDVWLVLTGAAECGLEGMRAFVAKRRKELDPASTYVLAIDAVGSGHVRWIASEGLTVSFAMDQRLLELSQAIAEADREAGDVYGAAPFRHGFASDALAARARGWRAAGITCREPGTLQPRNHHLPADLPEEIDPTALDRAEGFALELVRALDRDVGRARRAADRTPDDERS